jgi:hypothetical protein
MHVEGELAAQLLEMPNVIEALGGCQRALKLDSANPRLPPRWVASDRVRPRGPLVQSGALGHEPAILVQVTQDTVGWLSPAMRLRASQRRSA